MKFATATQNQEARTSNGMKARQSAADNVVSLFYAIGASRGQDIVPSFAGAFASEPELAVRVALWARDVRGGAGERKAFRDILGYLEKTNLDTARAVMRRVPELGRFDDLFSFRGDLRQEALALYAEALRSGNGLSFKWAPREKSARREDAYALRHALDMAPKQYRKFLAGGTTVVENQMCAGDWDNINFSHVPSLAAARYRTAFHRNTPKFAEYVEKLTKGDTSVKVNVGAVYPHDVIKNVMQYVRGTGAANKAEMDHIRAQWNALPNYMGTHRVLPMVDVSGSMSCPVGGSGSLSCIDVAVALGLYMADKNEGAFKDLFMSFADNPALTLLTGDIFAKITQMVRANWETSTNLHLAFDCVLNTGFKNNVPAEEMPSMIVILSDMQFNACVRHDDSAIEMIARKYQAAGYELPQVVFWNLHHSGNVPVSADKTGTALVSGFNPNIMTAILAAEDFTPRSIMMSKIMDARYDF